MLNAKKWYRILAFQSEFDAEFDEIFERAKNIEVPKDNARKFLESKKDYGLNLVYFLSICEDVKENFRARNIEEKYFFDLISIIKEEAIDTKNKLGVLGIYEVAWMCVVLAKDSLFRIGCLDFQIFGGADWFPLDLENGEKVLNVHIPATRRLDVDSCIEAMQEAKSFVIKYYPEVKFSQFVCYSWLLWPALADFLGENSNIVKFGRLFEVTGIKEQDDVLVFAFSKSATRENIAEFEAKTTLQRAIKDYILKGGKLFVGKGLRKF